MRYVIFSDVHGNLEALQAFVRTIESLEHDKKVCLGDIVGYGADPNACVDWVRENAAIVLGGNHDYAVVGKTDTSYFNPDAYQACLWTRKELTGENQRFLESLPVELEADGVYWVHSSPYQPEKWHYVTSRFKGEIHFNHFAAALCFLGHSHRPLILEKSPEGEIQEYLSPIWDVQPDCRYIFNVGSLGQPRDGNAEPSFVLYDAEAATVEFHRFPYDCSTTQKKILANGLPPFLAERLSLGM